MQIQGMPRHIVEYGISEKFSDNMLGDLSGNMFTGMTFVACAIAALVHAPTWTQSRSPVVAAVADLLGL